MVYKLYFNLKNILRRVLYLEYIKDSYNSVIKKTKQNKKTKMGIKFE